MGGRLQGWRVNTRGQRNEWNWGTGYETHKESIKSKEGEILYIESNLLPVDLLTLLNIFPTQQFKDIFEK